MIKTNKFNRKIPYKDLPLLSPNLDIETKEILRKTISAGRALAKLNITQFTEPNFIFRHRLLTRCKTSSKVENIITANDDIYKSLVANRKVDSSST
ncbi:hypothetical protein [Flavobacterium sp.]|uniref:hypothetical protein n=1 Tax=Flavobacterium sp. TaxID=239 RepID=UPI001B444901|nr:hypothetical protein [Flavobacterium sp.]MBP6182960.1 hypothetical protein [Flavobacterium sp.]